MIDDGMSPDNGSAQRGHRRRVAPPPPSMMSLVGASLSLSASRATDNRMALAKPHGGQHRPAIIHERAAGGHDAPTMLDGYYRPSPINFNDQPARARLINTISEMLRRFYRRDTLPRQDRLGPHDSFTFSSPAPASVRHTFTCHVSSPPPPLPRFCTTPLCMLSRKHHSYHFGTKASKRADARAARRRARHDMIRRYRWPI